jgi:hypothetical protein
VPFEAREMATPLLEGRSKGIWTWIAVLCFAAGFLAALFFIYDLKYPNRFVGDMYGMEVLFRLAILCSAAGLMLLGGVLLIAAWSRRDRRLQILGTVIVIASSLMLNALAVAVVHSRHLNEKRKSYPKKSVDELLAIVREEKDQHAVDALMIRADPAAVPGLALILLNENERRNLRYCAAQALARIGGDNARTALDKARNSSGDAYFKEFLDRMIEEAKSKP